MTEDELTAMLTELTCVSLSFFGRGIVYFLTV